MSIETTGEKVLCFFFFEKKIFTKQTVVTKDKYLEKFKTDKNGDKIIVLLRESVRGKGGKNDKKWM